MIRRTHQNKLFGAPLIQLPKNTQNTIQIRFNEVEMELYNRVKARYIRAINSFAYDGTLDEHMKMIMIMFQRLRQMVAHIFMAQQVFEREFEHAHEVDELREPTGTEATEQDSLERRMLSALRNMIEARGKLPEEVKEADILPTSLDEGQPIFKVGKAGSLTARFGNFLRGLKKASRWTELRARTCCQSCKEPPKDPLVTNCLHVYCTACLKGMALEAAQDDLDETSCLECGTAYTECQSCDGLKELKVPDFSVSMFQRNKDTTSQEQKFKLTMNWVDPSDGELLLSSKIIAVKEQLEKWIANCPGSKIIIFTEWYMVYDLNSPPQRTPQLTNRRMHLLGRICQQNKWNCCHVSRQHD